MGMNPNRQVVPLGGGESTPAAVYGDLLAEILVRLPAKSLIRLKLVCKHWLSVISGDEFFRRHYLRGPNPPPSLLLQTRQSKFFHINPFDKSPIMAPYKFSLPSPKILSSCNGLMLLQSDTRIGTDYYVHNPTTNQSRRVRNLDYSEDYPGIMGFTLAFDPRKSIHYTVVLVRAALKFPDPDHGRQSSGRRFRVDVYESESCCWEKGSEPFRAYTEQEFCSGVHCNGFIHWKNWCYDIGNKIIAKRCSGVPWHNELLLDRVSVFKLVGSVAGVFRSDGETSSLVVDESGEIKSRNFGDEGYKELVDLRNQPFYNHKDYVHFGSHNVHLFEENLAPVLA